MAYTTNVLLNAFAPWQESLLRELGEKSQAATMFDPDNPEKYKYPKFEGPRLAEFTPEIEQAHQFVKETQGQWAPHLQHAAHLLQQASAPFNQEAAQMYMDPYLRDQLALIQELNQEAYQKHVIPQLSAQFGMAGHSGSGFHQKHAAQLQAEMQNQIQQQQREAYRHAREFAAKQYGIDRAAQLEAAKEGTRLGGETQFRNLAQAAAIKEQGLHKQALEQERINQQVQAFEKQKDYPLHLLERRAAILHGMPAPTSGVQVEKTPPVPQWNTAGQALTALGNIGAAQMAYGRKAGGSIRKRTMNIPPIKPLKPFSGEKVKKPKRGQKFKKMGLGKLSLSQSSLVRMPKVGAKHGMSKGGLY